MSIAAKHAYRFGYLKSEQWQNVRAEVLARDDARCWLCNKRDLFSDVHHCVYPKNVWDTRAMHCVTICRECHEKVHELMKANEGASNWGWFRKLVNSVNPNRLSFKRIDDIQSAEVAKVKFTRILKFHIESIKSKLAATRQLLFSRLKNKAKKFKTLNKCRVCNSGTDLEFRHPSGGMDKYGKRGVWLMCNPCWERLLLELKDDRRWSKIQKFVLTIQQERGISHKA